MIDQLLELELGLIKARLDARKVLPKKSGKRPGKFCKGKSGKGSYIAAEKKCADHETTTPDGKRKLSESGKKSAEELAKKVRERKGMKGKTKVLDLPEVSDSSNRGTRVKELARLKPQELSEYLGKVQSELDRVLQRGKGEDWGFQPGNEDYFKRLKLEASAVKGALIRQETLSE